MSSLKGLKLKPFFSLFRPKFTAPVLLQTSRTATPGSSPCCPCCTPVLTPTATPSCTSCTTCNGLTSAHNTHVLFKRQLIRGSGTKVDFLALIPVEPALLRVVEKQDVNKMSPMNLATVFGPSLLRPPVVGLGLDCGSSVDISQEVVVQVGQQVSIRNKGHYNSQSPASRIKYLFNKLFLMCVSGPGGFLVPAVQQPP